ncbi:MAG TPA: metalloregulator ArsR/SmtB family transcription factor [Deltaproteobacteria bacterium]|nr:metalloregulator ArsR/SmtB family transcription factor [Deltaproteobacteria bacterium]HQB38773.1 metalloregulator ArsR/SmtB family transcription factor [Deltaproteobacteria bacterium]
MNELTCIFQSLSEEIRLRILALLLKEKELCVCDIIAALEIPQSTASRHLSNLKNCGWITDRKMGVWVHYSIPSQLPPLQQTLLPVLHHFMSNNGVVNSDLERLRQFVCSKGCNSAPK